MDPVVGTALICVEGLRRTQLDTGAAVGGRVGTALICIEGLRPKLVGSVPVVGLLRPICPDLYLRG